MPTGTTAIAPEDAPLPNSVEALRKEISNIKEEIGRIEGILAWKEGDSNKKSNDDNTIEKKLEANENQNEIVTFEKFDCPPHCIPICADVVQMMENGGFDRLGEEVGNFDVITMDPPWQLACANPTRGVAIGYSTLNINHIKQLPVQKLQKNGLIFIWVINMYYTETLNMMRDWGYKFVDDITWVKQTVNRRMAKSHGYYLQHAKESCLVGLKGEMPASFKGNSASDIIYAERLGQSQKPVEIYEIIEQLFPQGKYIEIFARRNNLRNYWFSIGNEL